MCFSFLSYNQTICYKLHVLYQDNPCISFVYKPEQVLLIINLLSAFEIRTIIQYR